MLGTRFRNVYNLNPVEIEYYSEENPQEEMFNDRVEKFVDEEKFVFSFIDIDKMRNDELIKMSQFDENYNGVLSHDGSIKVAKSHIQSEILKIEKCKILVNTKNENYTAEIHEDLKGFMEFIETGDIGFLKWKNGKCWLVGFKKGGL